MPSTAKVASWVLGAILVAFLALLIIAAASPGPADAHRSDVHSVTVDVDGRQVPCAVAETAEGVGISCDWSAR